VEAPAGEVGVEGDDEGGDAAMATGAGEAAAGGEAEEGITLEALVHING